MGKILDIRITNNWILLKSYLSRFAIPLTLSVPMILITMSSTCSMYLNNSCHYSDSFPAYIFWQCSNMDLMNDGSLQINALLWLLWLLSQIWLSFHVFTSSCAKCDRLASTDKLFLKPVYESLILGKLISHDFSL